MPTSCELTVTPAKTPGGTATIHVLGDVNGDSKVPFPLAYAEAVATGDPATILLDFSRVEYINSTGIAVIVGILAHARADRRAVSATGLSDHYKHIFTITRLVDFIHLIDADASVATPV
jgi:anti-sigma B factor antagonist